MVVPRSTPKSARRSRWRRCRPSKTWASETPVRVLRTTARRLGDRGMVGGFGWG
jgi:hypothetical protein